MTPNAKEIAAVKARLRKIDAGWTVVATRPRNGGVVQWCPVNAKQNAAGLALSEARRLVQAGLLISANRVLDDRIEFVVKPSAAACT